MLGETSTIAMEQKEKVWLRNALKEAIKAVPAFQSAH
jgi:hypothetical protein